ncbi:MAG: arginine--tRNA ligase [Methanobrevibacter sp.]|jgi:arginyl-tRNA synthetase|nr:arginine--tRNA ligase [Candidatus Methanovirga basalitermitum]
MYYKVIEEAKKILEHGLYKLNLEILDEIKLEFPPNYDMGDLTSILSFELAKRLKKSPDDVSKMIIKELDYGKYFKKIEATGPYINFFIAYDKFVKDFLSDINEDYGNFTQKNLKIILEHTSANPNGPLHIGHIRNGIIGDCLSRLLKVSGNKVVTQYYVNDMGRQTAMIVFGVKKLNLKVDEESSMKIDHEVGDLYFKVNQELNKNPDIKNDVDMIIKKYESGIDPNLNKIFKQYVNYCLKGVKETLLKLNISHDEFVWEGQFVRSGDVDRVIDSLIDSGYTKENEVLYLDLEEGFGIDKELVLKRSDGTSLYSTRDLAYHIKKSQVGDLVVDILGSDHKLVSRQLSAGLEILGEKTPEVVFYEFITLPEGSMSTRRGVFISSDDLIDEAIKRSKEELELRRPELNSEYLDKISQIIGIGAIRYYIAKLSPEKHITFKWDDALSFEKGCVSIQYAHARACKLLKKSDKYNDGDLNISVDEIENWELDKSEIDLIRLLAKFPLVIKESAKILRVHLMAHYVQDLATAFNKFYKSQKVIGDENELARLLIVNKTKITIRNALNILGIEAPEFI